MHGEHSIFTWLSLIPGLEHAPSHIVHTVFVAVVMMVTMFFARKSLSFAMTKSEGALVPPSKMTYRNFFEILAEKLYGLTESVIGHHDAPIYFPLIGTLFVFIFFSNLLGVVPGFAPPTDNLNTTLALGAFVFLYYNYVGLKTNGMAYLKHFLGPVLWLAPLMIIIEIISHLIRPISLGIRLRSNIMGDHMVLGVFSGLVPYVVPVVFLGLGMFVSFIQAFVFCLMTMVYISMATAHDH